MLSSEELTAWCERLHISPATRSVIDRVRSSEPARRVGGGRGNVSGRYPSRKMGVTIQFESHRVELAGIYEMEHDGSVEEFYDQPPSIKLHYLSAEGRHLGVMHTPDFFVIRRDRAGWEEWKTDEELVRLAEKSPYRYRHENGHHWRCPPGEEYAHSLALHYRVRSSGEINWVFQRNMQFLEDYLRSDSVPISSPVRERVRAYVLTLPGVSLQALLKDSAGVAVPDDIYSLIAMGQLYVDLTAAPLAEPWQVKVFGRRDAVLTCSPPLEQPSQNSCEPGVQVSCTGAPLTPNPVASEVIKRLLDASEDDLRVANERSDIVRRHLDEGSRPIAEPVSARALRRWLSAYRLANDLWGTGYVGLLPKRRPGNSTPRLLEGSTQLMKEAIRNEYETKKQKSRYACWLSLRRACEMKGVPTPSYMTFCTAVRQRAGFAQTSKRQGHRAAYYREPFYFELELKTTRHGDRPFEICHADHTKLDVELTDTTGKQVLGRPWMTLLMDAFSRCALAVCVDFDEPSYRSCMMLLRECVRLHNRLPQCLVVDGGPEFKSTYFETLLARYECLKKTRPPAKARFGSLLERLFGTTNTQFVHNLLGNTQITRNVRQVTKSVNPKGQAVWPIAEFYDLLCHYLYKIYNTTSHPALGVSPEEAYRSGFAKTGQRPQRMIAYDEDFLIFTLPTTARGTAKVLPGRGVKLNYVYYWSDVFRDRGIEQQRVAVRYNPFDAGAAYAFVGSQWVRCYSEHYTAFQGRSEKEVALATQELRRRSQNHAHQFKTSGRSLACFLESIEADEVLRAQRLRDREGRCVRTGICAVAPIDNHGIAPGTLEVDAEGTKCAKKEAKSHEIYGEF